MADTTSASEPPHYRQPPLTIAGRSFFDQTRLMWQGAGNILIALYCFFGAGGAGGIIFGILFLSLAIATWVIAGLASWDWYGIPPDYRRVIVGIGAVIGVTMMYLFFGIFFLVIWVVTHIGDWL